MLANLFNKKNLLHLRIPFSLFLMPVYFFALSQANQIQTLNCFLLFILLHLLIYPSSHAFNSYYDDDIGSIGGLENPPEKTESLLLLSNVLDTVGLLIALYINFACLIYVFLYILASRAYSYRPIRIKQYPIFSFIIVVIFQGALIYFLTINVAQNSFSGNINPDNMVPAIIASLIIASSYPITQIYQHKQDALDKVNTLSMLLGIKGTFYFSFILFAIIGGLINFYFFSTLQFNGVLIFNTVMSLPSIALFIWFKKVKVNLEEANYKNTMKYIVLASTCCNICFIILFFLNDVF